MAILEHESSSIGLELRGQLWTNVSFTTKFPFVYTKLFQFKQKHGKIERLESEVLLLTSNVIKRLIRLNSCFNSQSESSHQMCNKCQNVSN